MREIKVKLIYDNQINIMNHPEGLILDNKKKLKVPRKITPYYTEYPNKDNIDIFFSL